MVFNIPVWVPVVFFTIGILGLLTRTAFAKQILGIVGKPVGLTVDTVALVFVIAGIGLGAIATITGFVGGFGEAATVIVGGDEDIVSDFTGTISAQIHTGLSNTTTTEDFVNTDKDLMQIFSADASIGDGEEYVFNITVERSEVSEAAAVLVSCNLPDQDISGVTADNLAEKTLGEIDLDINDGGTHTDDNTVERRVAFSAGETSIEVQIAYDQEETYHDGLSDNQDRVRTTCSISDSDETVAVVHEVLAAS